MSVSTWAEEGSSPSLSQPQQGNSRKVDEASTQVFDNERSKRHLQVPEDGGGDLPFQGASEAKEMLALDPEDFPLSDDIDDIDTYINSPNYFDGHLEGEDSDFTLRRYAPGASSSRYVVSKEQPDEELKSSLLKHVLPRNCYDLLQEGNTQNGVYTVHPSGKGVGVQVWCEQEVAGGGWTLVIGRRAAALPHLNFTRTPTQYAHGFGTPSSNHWIGLEVMHELTQGISHTLRVHLQDQNGTDAHATYGNFRVGSRDEDYILHVGDYDNSSTAIDALTQHTGLSFSYPIPATEEGCSQDSGVGWWYLEDLPCYYALPTGQYQVGDEREGTNGVAWWPWRESGHSLQLLFFLIRPSTT